MVKLEGYLTKNADFVHEEKLSNDLCKVSKKCKCGHTVVVPAFLNKKECSWCHELVFRDDKAEFDFKLEMAMRRKKYEQISKQKSSHRWH